MIFWDTSAVVPLLVAQPETGRLRDLVRRDPELLVWWGTAVEVASALSLLEREGHVHPVDGERVRDALADLASFWSEVLPTPTVRGHAARLLRRHPLRAADALQLGAALTWARGQPDGHVVATLDDRLRLAAAGEGFRVAPGHGGSHVG